MRLDLEQMVERLATVRRPWLIAAARRAGAGADAEDAVQDVLARLAAGATLPRDERSALAYAATAVRRRALDLVAAGRRAAAAARRGRDARPGRGRTSGGGRCGRSRRRSTTLPERPRAVLVLDAAGWSRAAHRAAARGVGARRQARPRRPPHHRHRDRLGGRGRRRLRAAVGDARHLRGGRQPARGSTGLSRGTSRSATRAGWRSSAPAPSAPCSRRPRPSGSAPRRRPPCPWWRSSSERRSSRRSARPAGSG